ncbi:MAG: hypothetical protein COB30_001560 [Ectothiorhodospiraceae bacterium]|nr:hypothetical protein [Ectothiorhodospiraceae bacterium]
MFVNYSQYLVCCFFALVFLTVSNTAFSRGCASPANVGCSVAECEALQATMKVTCGKVSSCEKISTGCSDLQAMKGKWLACYTERNIINNRCYAGGDLGHQMAAASAIEHVGKCEKMIALPEPIGCADPCP